MHIEVAMAQPGKDTIGYVRGPMPDPDIEQGDEKRCIKFLKAKPCLHTVVKWAMPAMVNGLCIFLSMWMLHIATYYYVLYMDRLERDFSYAPHGEQHEFSGPYGALSPGLTPYNVSYGSLDDVPESFLPWCDIQISVLDAVAAALPFLWGTGTLYHRDLILWTKLMGCNAMLAFGKGLIGCMTIVPDSSGWKNCKARLGSENVDFLRHSIPNPFEKGQLATYWALLKMEIFGKQGVIPRGSGIRYCADMMYSGHTYFTCLYALGLLELLHRLTHQGKVRAWFFHLVFVLVVAEQSLEISLVMLNRFHYTSDVVVAILVTLLWYTNAPVVVCAKWWVSSFNQFNRWGDEGHLWIPCCCVPFCRFQGYHGLAWREARDVVSADALYLKSALQSKVLRHAFIINARDAHGLVISYERGSKKPYQILHVDPHREGQIDNYTESQLHFGLLEPRLWLWAIKHWTDFTPQVQNTLTERFEKVTAKAADSGDKFGMIVEHMSQHHVVLNHEEGLLTLLPISPSQWWWDGERRVNENEARFTSDLNLSTLIPIFCEKRLGDKENEYRMRLQNILEKIYCDQFYT